MISISAAKKDKSNVYVKIKEAEFPSSFVSGLEYSAPARGTWNIVHTGMLIPGAHQIFVCALGCLRGVVLTAAEMNAMDRFSSVVIYENNVLEGDMESLIIDGVADILKKLPKKPPAVLVYTSCIHHFMGCDLSVVYRTLREKFPDVAFADCYMNPIMRKSGLNPDQIMSRQLYSLLEKRPKNGLSINIIGNNFATYESSELVRMIRENGFELKDITLCRTYEDYLSMAESAVNISYNPVAKAGGDELERRLGQKHLYLPLCYGYKEITEHLYELADYLNIPKPDYTSAIEGAEKALKKAKNVLRDTPVAIDYTATMRPLGLARLLIEHGFKVDRVYADGFNEEEKDDFYWLKENSPELKIYPTVNARMRVLPRKSNEKMLAIGQKAAYFTGTENFVNIVQGGGMYGFDGICRMADLMMDAYINTKDTRNLIQIKGLGCDCLL
ncbi:MULTISPECIES: nitrogenase component 1 [Clostridium]|uniref:nitrogenase component 1 n=1 Tax=Clostridium TaxID=1485 RepID=UPI000B187993|nr:MULTISPECIES: nitrogenase component 1 [Clostridium]PJI10437.1 nitrogenase [Clostridium sp. CT7]